MHQQNIKEREEICRSCPIFAKARGICNPNLWLNPNTNETSDRAKAGYIRGCGCSVFIKMKNLSNHCVAGKW